VNALVDGGLPLEYVERAAVELGHLLLVALNQLADEEREEKDEHVGAEDVNRFAELAVHVRTFPFSGA
jgi:hypothetical protein